jgi:hypothetical protein
MHMHISPPVPCVLLGLVPFPCPMHGAGTPAIEPSIDSCTFLPRIGASRNCKSVDAVFNLQSTRLLINFKFKLIERDLKIVIVIPAIYMPRFQQPA